MNFRLNFLILMLLASACNGQNEKQEAPEILRWQAGLVLDVNNFTIINDTARVTQPAGNNLAVTRTGITYSITKTGNTKFEINLYATMRKSGSYLRRRVLDSSQHRIAYLLKHEQNHFDISEIYARYAARNITMSKFSKNIVAEVKTLMRRIFDALEAFQDEYDRDTRNGRDGARQAEWNRRLKAMLDETAPYKKSVITKTIS